MLAVLDAAADPNDAMKHRWTPGSRSEAPRAELAREVAEDRYVVDPDVVAHSILWRLVTARTAARGETAPRLFAAAC